MNYNKNFLYNAIKPTFKSSIPAGILKSIEAVTDLMLPFIMSKIIDIGVADKNSDYLIKMGSLMFFLIIFGYVSSIGCCYLSVTSAQNLGATLRSRIFSKIQFFTFNQLNKFSQASLITRATKDIDQLVLIYMMSTRVVLRILVTVIGAIIMAFFINKELSIFFLVFLPICIWIVYYYMKKSIISFEIVQKKLDSVSQILKENLTGLRVIRALAKESVETDKFDKKHVDFLDEDLKAQNIMDLKIPFVTLIMNMALVGVLWLGGIEINTGNVKLGEIIALINYLTMAIFLLTPLSFLFVIGSKAIVSYERLREIFEIEDSNFFTSNIPSTKNDDFKDEKQPFAIEFKNVSFSYNGQEPYVLENINLKIKKGENIAIIGGVGSGKSTLTSLIPRLYDATSGEIFVNNINVNDYDLPSLRKKIGMVLQRSFLFTGTVAQNIRWGKLEAHDSEVTNALEIAVAHDFIDGLPKKQRGIINKGGVNFSGGQKQRLSIARTIIRDSDILIFDDSFSALDSLTEEKVRRNINDKFSGTTKITISQKISQIKNADRIIILDNGKIVGNDTHDNLIENCPIYREICSSQDIDF